jgi:hypothetical protein
VRRRWQFRLSAGRPRWGGIIRGVLPTWLNVPAPEVVADKIARVGIHAATRGKVCHPLRGGAELNGSPRAKRDGLDLRRDTNRLQFCFNCLDDIEAVTVVILEDGGREPVRIGGLRHLCFGLGEAVRVQIDRSQEGADLGWSSELFQSLRRD